MSGSDWGEPVPTWEQLLTGVGVGATVRGRPMWRFAAPTPRHVRVDWEARWAELVRELRRDTSMPWGEAWAWTLVAAACAATASSATGLLR
jgi:hypothetical protein